MGFYRKKPVKIEARQWLGNNGQGIIDWIQEYGGQVFWEGGSKLSIATLEGIMEAWPGSWIVRGVRNEFYPVDPKIFAETYVEA